MNESETQRIEAVIAEIVTPLFAKDGGTARLVGVEGDCVTMALEGTYLGCPSRPLLREQVLVPLFSKELGRPIDVALD